MNCREVTWLASVYFYLYTLSLILCSLLAIHLDEPLIPFIIPAGITILVLVIILLLKKDIAPGKKFSIRLGFLSLPVFWLVFITIGVLPFMLSENPPSLIDAFFESVSGFTSTGTTMLNDLERFPRSLLFWRNMTQWLGGIATIFMTILVFPHLNIGGYKIFGPESAAVTNRTIPVGKMIFSVLGIYLLLTVTEIILLTAGGMSLFLGACVTFSTISTGNFYPFNTGTVVISPYQQYILIIFMFLSGISYVYYLVLVSMKLRPAGVRREIKFYISVLFTGAFIVAVYLLFTRSFGLGKSIREGFYQVTSAITTTRFHVGDFSPGQNTMWVLVLMLLIVGGCTVSPSGGIKMGRILVFLKGVRTVFRELNYSIAHNSLSRHNLFHVANEKISVSTFIILYLLVLILGDLALVSSGIDLKTATLFSISSLSTTCLEFTQPGQGMELVHFSSFNKITVMLLMFAGRLEIFPVVLFLVPAFYRKRDIKHKNRVK